MLALLKNENNEKKQLKKGETLKHNSERKKENQSMKSYILHRDIAFAKVEMHH